MHLLTEDVEITSAAFIQRPKQMKILKAPVGLFQQTTFHPRDFRNPREVLEFLETVKKMTRPLHAKTVASSNIQNSHQQLLKRGLSQASKDAG